jgi:hypothetical protein
MRVYMQLRETFSTEQVNGFDLAAFRVGDMEAAWAPLRTFAGDLATVSANTNGTLDGRDPGYAGSYRGVRNGTVDVPAEAQAAPKTGVSKARTVVVNPSPRNGHSVGSLKKAVYVAPDSKRAPVVADVPAFDGTNFTGGP